MKIYIFVDMEGISGISGRTHVMDDEKRYHEGRRLFTQDINACVRGCYNAGADSVLVRDGHSAGFNAILEEVDPRVEIIQGMGARERLSGIEECDALILLGYHARAGTRGAVMEHTYSSAVIQNIWMNGRVAGEFAIDAGVASDYGVPTIMVSGDDYVCREALEWVPEVVTCQVKTGLGVQCARLLPLPVAHALIEEKAAEAVRKIGEIPPLKIERPVTLRKEGVERAEIPSDFGRDYLKVIDSRTVEVTAPTVEEALFKLW